jgi:hypothetical protein
MSVEEWDEEMDKALGRMLELHRMRKWMDRHMEHTTKDLGDVHFEKPAENVGEMLPAHARTRIVLKMDKPTPEAWKKWADENNVKENSDESN